MPPSRPRNSARNGWGFRGNCPAKAALARSMAIHRGAIRHPRSQDQVAARRVRHSTVSARDLPEHRLRLHTRQWTSPQVCGERNRIALILQPLEQLQEVLRLTDCGNPGLIAEGVCVFEYS